VVRETPSSVPISSRTLIVPVAYGGEYGPDLDAVASKHRVRATEVIRAHTSHDYRVGFLGFLPGFAYMGPIPLGLATSRLATPRVRVPAGSVAVAGRYTAIYPAVSPGGWNLIGRTDIPLWDPSADPPAYFAPGDTIRFVQSASVGELPWPASSAAQPRFPLFEVESPGALSLIQDEGRAGYAHLGLGRGGVSDELAASRANALVGNAPSAAILEMAFAGPRLRVLRGTVIALEGADLGCRVDGLAVPTGVSWFVRTGSTLNFVQTSPSESGATGYLAVAGGFDVPVVLGSRATCLMASFGGHRGRPLQIGDVLGVAREPEDNSLQAGKFWLPKVDLRIRGHATLRIIRYGGRGAATRKAFAGLTGKLWTVSPDVGRVGLRLLPEDGEPLPTSKRGLPSFGVVRGTVQLPPGGNPLVLGVDAGTTGGYPVLGVIAQCDWPLLAQLRPGDRVTLDECSAEDARWERHGQLTGMRQGRVRLGLSG
jgi:biotin-dependent carboxylase-like uncharacterized protein